MEMHVENGLVHTVSGGRRWDQWRENNSTDMLTRVQRTLVAAVLKAQSEVLYADLKGVMGGGKFKWEGIYV